MMVLFGTGKFMELGDKAPTQTQTFYGMLDPNTLDRPPTSWAAAPC